MRSSSEESQLIAFSARSRFPLKRRNVLAAHNELPTTTKRPWEFSLPVLNVPAAPSVNGPFLFFGSLGLTAGESNFSVARLDSEELKELGYRRLIGVLYIQRPGERKSRLGAFHAIDDGMGIISRNQRHFRPNSH